jgi:hypothetical protein
MPRATGGGGVNQEARGSARRLLHSAHQPHERADVRVCVHDGAAGWGVRQRLLRSARGVLRVE